MMSKEAILHQQVCQYLRMQYPDIIFRTDFAAGIKMTIGQASKHRRLQSGRAYPDLFIAQPIAKFYTIDEQRVYQHCGLFIELKATNIYKKDGTLKANDHVKQQARVLGQLEERGYIARFAIGFDQAKRIIDAYMEGKL